MTATIIPMIQPLLTISIIGESLNWSVRANDTLQNSNLHFVMAKFKINTSVTHLESLEASTMMCYMKQHFKLGNLQVFESLQFQYVCLFKT